MATVSQLKTDATSKKMGAESVDVKMWREGKNVLVRCDKFHNNTHGKNLKEAFANLVDALSIHVE